MEKHDIDVDELVHETDAAWLFLIDGQQVWLPKSQCEYDGRTTVSGPEWLLAEKGLI